MIPTSLAGLPAFAGYFAAAMVLSMVFVIAYTAITPFREIDLIRHGNSAAAIQIGMGLIGFSIPLASAIYHSANIIDCVVWGVVALLTQLIAYGIARLTVPNLADDIAKAHVAPAIWLGSISIASGIISAACMSY
jgi:putative membrane protein